MAYFASLIVCLTQTFGFRIYSLYIPYVSEKCLEELRVQPEAPRTREHATFQTPSETLGRRPNGFLGLSFNDRTTELVKKVCPM